MASQQWFFHWDNAPVHATALVNDWMAARQLQARLLEKRGIDRGRGLGIDEPFL
jgi:hypothetical protein